MTYYVNRLRLVSGCARALAASLAPLSRPVARLRTSNVVTESIHDSLSLACQLKTSTASCISYPLPRPFFPFSHALPRPPKLPTLKLIPASQPQPFRHDETLSDLEEALRDQREQGGGNRAGENQADVVEADAGEDGLAVAARAD